MNQVARRISAAWRRRRCFRRLKLCSRSSHEGRCLPIQASKYVGKRPFALASFFVSAGFGLQFFVLIAFFLLPRSAKNSRGRAIFQESTVSFFLYYASRGENLFRGTGRTKCHVPRMQTSACFRFYFVFSFPLPLSFVQNILRRQ